MSQLTSLAEQIITDGPRHALHAKLSDREVREWSWAARGYLTAMADGLDDVDDFAGMVYEFFNPPSDQSWALDADFLRDERVEWRAGL